MTLTVEQEEDVPIKESREYRFSSAITQVDGAEGEMVVEGYATTFDIPYEMEGSDICEVITSDALNGADMSDVIFQFDHQGPVMARVRNKTLQITQDAHGLHIRADLSKSEDGRKLYESIKNGLVDRMSWAFTIADGGWAYDINTNTRTISKIEKVYDVSAVSIPANQGTDIHARSASDGAIGAIRQEFAERQEKELEKRKRLSLLMEIDS